MPDPALVLHHFPGACSSVSVCALHWAQLPHELRLVDVSRGEQAGAAYRAVSALGKVPALLVDGRPLLENVAILCLVDALRPAAGLLPGDTALARAEAIGGLSFCAGTLHPLVRGLVNPARVTAGDGEPVRERSREGLASAFGHAEARLARAGWWLGRVSIVDVYLDWAFSVASRVPFDAAPYPRLSGLAAMLDAELPAYRAMQAGEARARAALGL